MVGCLLVTYPNQTNLPGKYYTYVTRTAHESWTAYTGSIPAADTNDVPVFSTMCRLNAKIRPLSLAPKFASIFDIGLTSIPVLSLAVNSLVCGLLCNTYQGWRQAEFISVMPRHFVHNCVEIPNVPQLLPCKLISPPPSTEQCFML